MRRQMLPLDLGAFISAARSHRLARHLETLRASTWKAARCLPAQARWAMRAIREASAPVLDKLPRGWIPVRWFTQPQPVDGASSDPLGHWRTVLRSNVTTVVAFSIFVNVLMLTLPIYLFQISDRVLTSRSLETLLMLSLLAAAFITVL